MLMRGKASLIPSAVLIALLLLLCACPAGAESAKLTVMVYMTGSSLESDGQAASHDLMEMMDSVPAGDDIQLIVLPSGAKKWGLDIDRDEASIYRILPGSMEKVFTFGEKRNMGDPATLSRFLSWGRENFPADRYALILWDHGGGPLEGVCLDERFTDEDGRCDRLTLGEISQALGSTPFRTEKLTLIGFDACLMGSLETALTVSPFAEYMTASPDIETDSGWDYGFLRDLTGDENGAALSEGIIASYEASLKDYRGPVTLVCLDLGRSEAVLEAVDAMFSAEVARVSAETYKEYSGCRSDCKALGRRTSSGYDLVDLLSLVSLYEENGLADGGSVSGAVRDMIVCMTSNDKYIEGPGIYYPFDNIGKYVSSWDREYSLLSTPKGYVSFLSRMSEMYLGDPMIEWKTEYPLLAREEGDITELTASLSPEEEASVSRARLLVLEETAPDAYVLVYYDDSDISVGNGAVSAGYGGEALFEVDADGNAVSGPYSYIPLPDGISLYGLIEYNFDPLGSFDQKFTDAARLVYTDNGSGIFTLSDVMTPAGGSDTFLPSSTRPEDWAGITIFQVGPVDGESATSLSFGAKSPEYLSAPPERLAFVSSPSANPRTAYIRITDMQGYTVCTETVPIK